MPGCHRKTVLSSCSSQSVRKALPRPIERPINSAMAPSTSLHRNGMPFGSKAGDGEVRPLADHLRQLRPALDAQAGESLFLHQLAHGQVAARIDAEVVFGHIFEPE